MNAREELEACANWLDFQNEDMSFGLRKPEDGLKLWRYWQSKPSELPEMADEETDDFSDDFVARHRKKALGYDPLGVKAQAAAYAKILAKA